MRHENLGSENQVQGEGLAGGLAGRHGQVE